MKKLTTKNLVVGLLAVMLAGIFALPNAAHAQADDPTVAGKGWLYANGTGDVEIDMGGQIRVRVDGDVSITDNSGDMRYRVRSTAGDGEQERLGDVVLSGFHGFINVRGSDFTITLNGDVMLGARGRGQANLVGAVSYTHLTLPTTPYV